MTGTRPPMPPTPPANLWGLPAFRLLWLVLFWGAAVLFPATGAAAPSPESSAGSRQAEPLPAVADFHTCVKLALKQSPYFTKSALEIEVRRLDEKDSKSEYLPTVNLKAKYYLSQPSRATLSNPADYSLDFSIESFNPIAAHYGVKIRQLLKQVAVLSHMKIISQGLKHLGNGFLELESLAHLEALQGRLLEVAGQHLAYSRRRLEVGEASLLEVNIATQELEVAKVERERLREAQKRLRERLRSFLGLDSHQSLDFAADQGSRQVLGEAAALDWDQVQPRSLDARMEVLKKELQSWNLTLAKLRLLPGLTAAVQTPDPIALTGVKGYFFSVGLTWPVFDGFRRLRDVSRQRTILAQADADVEVKDRDFRSHWREAVDRIKSAGAACRLARSQLELARLKGRQAELKYQAGEPLGQALAGQRALLEAEGQVILKNLEYHQAILEARHLSGDLVKGYVSEHHWLP